MAFSHSSWWRAWSPDRPVYFRRSEQNPRAQQRAQIPGHWSTSSWHTCASKTVTLGSERVGQTAAATFAFLLVSLRRLLILVRCAAANRTATGARGPYGTAMKRQSKLTSCRAGRCPVSGRMTIPPDVFCWSDSAKSCCDERREKRG